ncbi:MAG: hypothetical protein Q8R70_12120 [Methanoregula sp.]|nr:hypothetical protein [Methanoregula sp.]
MQKKYTETQYRYRLLLAVLGIILFVQAGSAALLVVKTTVSPSHVYLGQSVTISTHVTELDYPGVMMANVPVKVRVMKPSLATEYLTATTNSSGWATMSYTPGEIGDYGMTDFATVDYSTIPGLPPGGVQTYPTSIPLLVIRDDLNVTAALPFITRLPTYALVPLATLTTAPTAQPVTPAATVQPVVTGTQVTPETPVTPVVPPSQADHVPPVTTLTIAGTEDGNGWYREDVTCTLSAMDNAGGSGVSVTQYSLDGTSWYSYAQPVSLVKPGVATLYYRSADNAGNTEPARVKAIVISGPGAASAGLPVLGTAAAGTSPASSMVQPATGGAPLPSWLITVMMLVIVAVIGGALYWKVRPGTEEPKK